MSKKHTLLISAFILTSAGFLTRLIGFFFHIFLSHTFGAEQVGLYQLIFPVYALCLTLSSAGMESAISRCVARNMSFGKKKEASRVLFWGMGISLIFSVMALLLLQAFAQRISLSLLEDARCIPLLTAISYAIPFSAVHSCFCGYYLGLRQAKIPALSQLTEQMVRVGFVILCYRIAAGYGREVSILFAVLGVVAGECASALFCLHCFSRSENVPSPANALRLPLRSGLSRELLSLALPLSANRILGGILQITESFSIPRMLRQYGYSPSAAISHLGVLTGMALPCILFPSAITGAFSTLLLPEVAKIQAQGRYDKLKVLVQKVFLSCLLLGMACCLGFLLFGSFVGNVLFQSSLAGDYIKTLAWICPFLYLNIALASTINGLGKPGISFAFQALGILIRIAGVFFAIPIAGLQGYLWGMLLGQFVTCILSTLYLNYSISKRVLTRKGLR